MTVAQIDFELLMQANLNLVFRERNAQRRLDSIRRLYANDATLIDAYSSVTGHEQINAAISSMLSRMPENFAFRSYDKTIGFGTIGQMKWYAGSVNDPKVLRGVFVIFIEDGLICSLSVVVE